MATTASTRTVESFATLTLPSPLVQAMGGEDAYNRLTAKTGGMVTSVERHIMRYNPETELRGCDHPRSTVAMAAD
jgi:hypothetical protein